MQPQPQPQPQPEQLPKEPARKAVGAMAVVLLATGALLNGLSFIGALALMIMAGEAAVDSQFIGAVIFGIVFYVINIAVVVTGMVMSCFGLSARHPKKTAGVVGLVLSIGNILALIIISIVFLPVASGIIANG